MVNCWGRAEKKRRIRLGKRTGLDGILFRKKRHPDVFQDVGMMTPATACYFRLNIEPEQHDVSILDHVVLAF